jgi:hypothetical protein
MNKYLPHIYPLIALLLTTGLAGQTRVEAIVDDTKIAEGASFQLEIRAIDGTINNLRLNSLTDFEILSGPATSRSVQIVNGAVSSTSSYKWTLAPKKAGTLIIPAQQLTVDRRKYETKPITIQVLKAAPRSGSGSVASGELYLMAELASTEVYRGEQVTVTWTLFTQVNISGWEVASLPNFTGFWTEELFAPNKLQLRERVIGGKRYYTAVVRRMALFPTRSGELEIDPLVLKIGLPSQQRRRDPFFDDFSFFNRGRIEQRNVPSNTIRLEVIPVPTRGRPEGFDGLVGRYRIEGGLDFQEVDQDEAVTMTLVVSGEGNLKTMPPPQIEFPQGLEVFDPKVSSEANMGDVLGGKKTFEYVIIPRRAGTITIDPVEIAYFDPDAGRYRLASIASSTLEVRPRDDTNVATPGYSRQEVAILGKDIRFVKLTRPRWLKVGRNWYDTQLLVLNLASIILFASPWLFAGGTNLLTRIAPNVSRRKALPKALKIVRSAQKADADSYQGFNQAITYYLNHKLGRESQEYTRNTLQEIMQTHSIGEDNQIDLLNQVERIGEARFAPIMSGSVEDDGERLIRVLKTIDGEWS